MGNTISIDIPDAGEMKGYILLIAKRQILKSSDYKKSWQSLCFIKNQHDHSSPLILKKAGQVESQASWTPSKPWEKEAAADRISKHMACPPVTRFTDIRKNIKLAITLCRLAGNTKK